jgi:hypothetical protein
MPQAAGLVSGHSARCPLGFNIASQQAQNLAERQVRIADARMGIAVSAGDDQVGVVLLGESGEFLHQGCLATPGVAGDENHLPPAGQRCVEKPVKLRQLAFPGDKDRPFDSVFSFQEERRLSWEIGEAIRGWRWWSTACFDGFGKLSGRLLRRYAQFVLEKLHTLVILAQGGGPSARPGVQLHQLAMCLLVQRIERQPAPCIAYGQFELALGRVPTFQSLQRAGQLAMQDLGLEQLPIIKV